MSTSIGSAVATPEVSARGTGDDFHSLVTPAQERASHPGLSARSRERGRNSARVQGGARTPGSSGGRPSRYSEEMAARLCEAIRTRGVSDAAAAKGVGISEVTLWRWKRAHPELAISLAMARRQYREAKLAVAVQVTAPCGRPGWRAQARALRKAFPADYRSPAEARRAAAKRSAGAVGEHERMRINAGWDGGEA